MISIHDAHSLEQLRSRLRFDPHCIRRLRKVFFKKQGTADDALTEIPEPHRDEARREISFHALTLHSRHDSAHDGASKLLFRTAEGQLIESVILRIASGRTSLCISSQVGCAVRCRFCATGQKGLIQDLTRDSILDQVIQANQLLRDEGRSIRNVVFMGMGEPLLNESAVYESVETLISPDCFNLSPNKVLISTVGIPDAMLRCAERFPRVRMALSLHSARQSEREKLIPLARRYPLHALRESIARVTAIQRRPLMIEYLLLEGVNDSAEDLDALIDYLNHLDVHLNLIPYNPISAATDLRGTPIQRRRAFAETLTDAGFKVTMRYSLGSDIAAACGQLATREDIAGRF
ncbi:MAG: 23S rRNA (adenine(2503)-C(2))-methyltransferase RlmN [Gemmataceae bacterium]